MVGEEDSCSNLVSEFEDFENNEFMVGMSEEQKVGYLVWFLSSNYLLTIL